MMRRIENLAYRLPTEAEWEYACRAGAETPFSYGMCLSTDQAKFDGNYPLEGWDEKGEFRGKTVPMAGVHPNTWGLYDMHGNVWELCQDWWTLYPLDLVIDPKGLLSGTDWYPSRIVRGGSWLNSAWRCRPLSAVFTGPRPVTIPLVSA